MQASVNFLNTTPKFFERLPVSALNVDDSYQKPLRMSHVRKIVKNFDPMGVGQIHVNRRNDGTYWIFDGQHRTAAYRELGLSNIECVVYEGLTHEQEVKGYKWYNTTMKEQPLNAFKVELEQEDPAAIDINNIALSQGLGIDYKQQGNQPISAIVALKDVYHKSGRDALINTLIVLHEAFGDVKKAYQSFLVRGVNQFMQEYQDKETFDREWLIKNLNRHGLSYLIQEKNAMRQALAKDVYEATKIAVLKIYNHNKRKENKL